MSKKTTSVANLAKLSPVNNPSAPGTLATPKAFFGDFHRYAVAAINTRFDAVQWFVWDADLDDGDGPGVIRQASTLRDALGGIEARI